MADVSLRSLGNTHLEVDGVADDIDFRRVEVIEQVSVVPVGITHGILVLGESLLEQLLVIDVTLLHAQQGVQVVRRIDRVAHPCDVTDVVTLAFVNLQIDADMTVIDIPYGVLDDDGIAEAQLVVFLYQVLLVLLVALIGKLLRLQEGR